MNKLLSCFHGGFLWLDNKVPVTLNLISHITRMQMERVYPSQYFQDKDTDEMLDMNIKMNYDFIQYKLTYVLRTINDKVV